MNICITGSRSLVGEMGYVIGVVRRCKELGATVIVGDAPGIDSLVSLTCAMEHVPCIVHYIAAKPRRWAKGNNLCHVKGSYLARDRFMVERADIVFAIWDGRSRGTKYTYDYAVKQGVEAHLRFR